MRSPKHLSVLLVLLVATLYADEERDYSFIKALFNDKSYMLVDQEADRFITEYPSSRYFENVFFLKAEAQFMTKDFKSSATVFSKFAKRFPNSEYADDALLRAGQSYFHLVNYDSSITVAERMPQGPLYYDAQYLIGESFYRKKDYQTAVHYYENVLTNSLKKEQIPLALYSLGFCYQNLKNYQKAITYFDSLINSSPASELNREASLAKGACLAGLGETDQAVKYLENVSEQNEVVAAQAKILIAEILLDKKEYERARIQYERIIRYYPESDYLDDGQFGIGMSYYLENSYVRAIDAFETLLKNFPKSELFNKGRYYLGLSLNANQDFAQVELS